MTMFVLLRKELTEHSRTYKFLSVVVVFLVVGFSTPVLLVYMPEIVELSGDDVVIEIPEFTATDIVRSYLDTLGQLGLVIVILITMGSIAAERERGTAEMVLSKPVGTGSFVLAKFLGLAIVLIAGLLAGALGCYTYTTVLLGSPGPMAFTTANMLVALYLLAVMSVTLLFSAIVRSQIVAGILALAVVIAAAILASLSILEPYLPVSMMHWAMELPAGTGDSRWVGLAISMGIVAVGSIGAWRVLQRKEL